MNPPMRTEASRDSAPPLSDNTAPRADFPPAPGHGPRLMSVDALRGFDLFWIIGAGALVRALDKMSANAVTGFLTTQLQHAQWEGFRFYDLIFPLFLFIVGVSMVFSLDRALAAGGRARSLGRVLRRSVLLFALGVFYYGGFSNAWPEVQLGGVLHRIALCYLCGALIYCFARNVKGLAAVSAALLLGYWALLSFVPFPDLLLQKSRVQALAGQVGSDSPHAIAAAVPERVRGVYEEGRNLTNYVDFLYLPGKKAQLYYINEGLLSTIPSIALTLFGALAGLLLKNGAITPHRKIAWLVGAGAAGVALGLLWAVPFPIIKRIWTSSFILLTGGLSAMLLALFYYLVDVRQWRAWCRPFVWLGANAITIYVVAQIVDFQKLALRFAGGDIKNALDEHVARGMGSLLVAFVGLTLVILFARFLYKRNIFLRV
jgi:predicted acyltransferase